MKIDILSETTLKLTLTEADMEDSRLCYETLSRQDGDCRRALERLIESSGSPKSAAFAAELFEEESKLLVEAFPSAEGGCFVYLSSLNRNRSKKKALKSKRSNNVSRLLDKEAEASPIIFETASGEMLGKLCRCLSLEKEKGACFESKLFSDNDVYRLALTPLNTCAERLTRILKEFGEAYCCELTAAYTQEYFCELVNKRAVEVCREIF